MIELKLSRAVHFLTLLLGAGCAAQQSHVEPPPNGVFPFAVSSTAAQHVTDGVWRRVIRSPTGPWTINVLYVDLDRCNSAEAVKGADSAAGRFKVTEMLAALRAREPVVGGVNADFFTLSNGAPTNLLIVNGRMLTPPNKQPVLAFDSAGAPHIETFTLANGRLAPFYPKNAVGGRPRLVRDSVIVGEVDTEGQA